MIAGVLFSGCAIGVFSFDDTEYGEIGKTTNKIIIGETDKEDSTDNVCSLEVILTSPADNGYVDSQFEVSGFVGNTETLSGVIIFIETPEGAILSAEYSSIESNTFSAIVNIDIEGDYRIWVCVWDTDDRMGKSDKVSVIAGWDIPLVSIESYTVKQNGDVIISGIATGRGSDIDTVYMQINGDGFFALEGKEEWSKTTALPSGYNLIEVYAIDKAGNISETAVTVINLQFNIGGDETPDEPVDNDSDDGGKNTVANNDGDNCNSRTIA
jgi:hypothetical protein